MAKYKDAATAQADLGRKLQAKAAELRPIYDSKDPKDQDKADKLKAEIGKIQNQLMMSGTGLSGAVGVLGGGLSSGVVSALTGIPDLALMGYNYFQKPENKVQGLGETFAPGLEATSNEKLFKNTNIPILKDITSAGLFGFGRGAGSSVGMGRNLTALNIGTNVVDETMFNGIPVTQLLSAAGLLSQAGLRGAKNWQENRGIKKMQEQLGPEGISTLKEFVLRGQDSSDPRVAGIVGDLRKNKDFAEIFNVLETGMAAKALEGARATTKAGYDVKGLGPNVQQAVEGKVLQLREAIRTNPAKEFEAAKLMGGGNDIIMTDKTVSKLDELVVDLSKRVGRTGAGTDDAKAALSFVGAMRDDLSQGRISVERMQALLSEFGSQAKQGESLIKDVSLGTQKTIASAIFGGLKDDLKATRVDSTVPRIREITANLLSARAKTEKAYNEFSAFASQKLPKQLDGRAISSIDTDEMLDIIRGLKPAQKESLFGVLQDTAPEDATRIRQVLYDDFVQPARKTLPTGEQGVDVKLVAQKFLNATDEEKRNLALAVGDNFKDFSEKMTDVNKAFKYQQTYASKADSAQIDPTLASQAGFALTGGSYLGGKLGGMAAGVWNAIKGGLSDENMFNFLSSPETKALLKESIVSPNSAKTIERLDRVLAGRDITGTKGNIRNIFASPDFGPTKGFDADIYLKPNMGLETGNVLAAARVAGDVASKPDENTLSVPAQQAAPTEEWDIGPLSDFQSNAGVTVQAAPAEFNNAPAVSGEEWDIGPLKKSDPKTIEQKIRSVAQAKGLGQYADMFVKQAIQESSLNPFAIGKETKYGKATGVFQHIPATAKELGITNPFDEDQSISGGITYMGQLLKQYNNDPRKALAAYNWGMGNLKSQGMNNAPPETQNYIKTILGQ
jgi:hypothetical protein